ncbi:MAG: hypothetical protein AAGH15_16630 [Myxococcota bacterium]
MTHFRCTLLLVLSLLGVACAHPADAGTTALHHTPEATRDVQQTRRAALVLAPAAVVATLATAREEQLALPATRRPNPNAELLAATKRRFHGDCIRAWNATEREVSIELGPRGRVLPTPSGAYVRLYARW